MNFEFLAIVFLLVPFFFPSFLFFEDVFIYFCARERERDIESWSTHKQGEGQREKQAPLWSREPDVGLDPRTLGSRPELKADG